MKSISTALGLVLAASLALPLSACSHETVLRPAAGASSVGGGSELTVAYGVQLGANGEAWPGKQDVRSRITPVHVTVFNDTYHPLEIRYDRFMLMDEYGHSYAALPPFEMRGSTVSGMYGELEPGFAHGGFKLDRAYAGLYPGMAVSNYGSARAEQAYHTAHYAYWGAHLPSHLMLRWALPEGVLEPGGHVGGYLYFEHVPNDAGNVDLNVQLAHAPDSRVFGYANVPFTTR